MGLGDDDTRDVNEVAAVDAPRSPVVGELFDGRYKIEELVGKGGFGSVYAARDTSLGRDVAIKVLSRALGSDATLLARFLQEARAAASLESEHVARVHEVTVARGGIAYIVMERLRGCDLQAEFDARRKLPVDEALELVLEITLGLAHAHARGIVHRDLKPRNVFLAKRVDGTRIVKILDFGVAKSEASDLTESGAVLGTMRYMAPEQIRNSRNVDARADIWALGVILYELTTGRPIFDVASSAEFGALVLVEPHVPMRKRDPELPVALERVVDRCLAKEPAGRFEDLAVFARAVAALGPGADTNVVPRVEQTLHGATTVSTRPRRRRILPITIALGVVGAGAAAIAWNATPSRTVPDARIDVIADALPEALIADVLVAEVLGADAVIAIDAVVRNPVPVPGLARGPSFEEVGGIVDRCDTKVAKLIDVEGGMRDLVCLRLGQLGCVEIKRRCTKLEGVAKDSCLRYVEQLNRPPKVCVGTPGDYAAKIKDDTFLLTHRLRAVNTRCSEVTKRTIAITGKVESDDPENTACGNIPDGLYEVCRKQADSPKLADAISRVKHVVCKRLPDRTKPPRVELTGSVLTVWTHNNLDLGANPMPCAIAKVLGFDPC